MKRFFPKVYIDTMSSTGRILTDTRKDVWIKLYRDGDEITLCKIYSNKPRKYNNIKLFFDRNTLVGYRGVFTLPGQVLSMLREAGKDVTRLEGRTCP